MQGEHGGNLFSLLLRHVDADSDAVRRAVRAVRRRGFVNYFGHQRWGGLVCLRACVRVCVRA